MSMTPFNGDLTQSLKWEQNNASAIQSLVAQKAAWYTKYNTTFWTNWEQQVFDLRTATPFGLMVWCVILGVPSQLFGLFPNSNAWAYGEDRQNFVYGGGALPATDRNLVGGNFAGGGNTTVVDLDDVRHALQLRYVSLVSNGRLSFINQMLRYIFNDNQPWDFPGKRYFYVADKTIQAATGIAAITADHYMEYRVGANMGLSSQFVNLLNSAQYGITPSCAGTKYLVVQES